MVTDWCSTEQRNISIVRINEIDAKTPGAKSLSGQACDMINENSHPAGGSDFGFSG
jgi:hypothetical protein